MYQFREVILKNGPHKKKTLVIDFKQPEMEIVREFLMSDAPLLKGAVLTDIDNVLSGKTKCITSQGNRCRLEIRRDQTLITDLFQDMDGVNTLPAYMIDTDRLRELIIMWLNKLSNFSDE